MGANSRLNCLKKLFLLRRKWKNLLRRKWRKTNPLPGEIKPPPFREADFCFFLLKFSRNSTHLQGEKTSSGNESSENILTLKKNPLRDKLFSKKIIFQSGKNSKAKSFSELSFPEDVFSSMVVGGVSAEFQQNKQTISPGGSGLGFFPKKVVLFSLEGMVFSPDFQEKKNLQNQTNFINSVEMS